MHLAEMNKYNKKYKNEKRTTRKVSAETMCRILFFGCFFISIFVANTLWKNEAAWTGYVFEAMITGIKIPASFAMENVFVAIKYRVPVWIVLVLFGRLTIGIIGAISYAGIEGYLYGFVLSSFILRFGVYGIIVFVAMIIPHIVFYVLSYVVLYRINFCIWRYGRGKFITEEQRFYYNLPQRKAKSMCGSMVLLFMGIITESYVNVIFLIKILEFLKNF